MSKPYDDPIVREKHRVQETILNEAGGDLRKYNEIVHNQAKEIRKKHPGRFRTASPSQYLLP